MPLKTVPPVLVQHRGRKGVIRMRHGSSENTAGQRLQGFTTDVLLNTYEDKRMNNQYLMDHLRSIPDFPQKGILFRDVTTLFKDAKCLEIMENELYEMYKDKGITKVVGIESRGFVMGAILARRLNAGLALCRKPGKLPAETIGQTYEKEYGTDTIEIHKDAITEDDVVLLHDDLLATGGTIKAAWDLVRKFNPKKCYMNFIIEIRDEGLQGREFLGDGIEISTLITV